MFRYKGTRINKGQNNVVIKPCHIFNFSFYVAFSTSLDINLDLQVHFKEGVWISLMLIIQIYWETPVYPRLFVQITDKFIQNKWCIHKSWSLRLESPQKWYRYQRFIEKKITSLICFFIACNFMEFNTIGTKPYVQNADTVLKQTFCFNGWYRLKKPKGS